MAEAEPVGWERCPADVMLSIFRMLDTSSLVCCFNVNSWWRSLVDYFAQHYKTWPPLAQEMMANRGSTFFRKSLLDGRDIFMNYLLWHHVDTAQIVCDCELVFDNITYLHIYRDLLTVVYGQPMNRSQMKCFKVTEQELNYVDKATFKSDPKLNPTIPDTYRNYKQKIYDSKLQSELSECLVQKMIQEGPFVRMTVMLDSRGTHLEPIFNENAFVVLDKFNNFIQYSYNALRRLWSEFHLTRYYGPNETLDSLDFFFGDKLLYLKNGSLMHLTVNDETNCIENLGAYYRPHRQLHAEKICKPVFTRGKWENVKRPIPDSKAFVESGKQFVGMCTKSLMSISRHKVLWIGEYPDLTSATQHGDMLLLGFDDGRIEIYRINFKVLSDPSPPLMRFNIKDYIKDHSKNTYKVIVIEVYEVRNCHHLLVATPHTFYRLVITYPEHIIQTVEEKLT